MNRNQFDNKYSAFNIHAAEMERKWALHLREQEEMEFMRRAAQGTDQTLYVDPESLYMDEDYMNEQQNYVL
jgi:hypothetical protein